MDRQVVVHLNGSSTPPGYSNSQSGAREWILLEGGCVVSAEFLQIVPGSENLTLKKPVDSSGQWLEGKLMGVMAPTPVQTPVSSPIRNDLDRQDQTLTPVRKKGKYCGEAAAIFDILDLDRDGLITYEELSDSLICHPVIANRLGIMSAEDRQAEMDNLFDLKYGVERHLPADLMDRSTFVLYFGPTETNVFIRPFAEHDIPVSRVSFMPSHANSPESVSRKMPKEAEIANLSWKNESAIDCWLSGQPLIPQSSKVFSPGTSIASQSTTPFILTPLSSDAKAADGERTVEPVNFLENSRPPALNMHSMQTSRSNSNSIKTVRNNTASGSRYHLSAETLSDSLRGRDNIILETFLVIPPDVPEEIVNGCTSWPVGKNSYLMQL